MLKATTKLKQEISNRKEEVAQEGYHQTILNIMYQHWQQKDTNKDYEEILNWFEEEYGELARFAVQIGKYNQQVCNGGHYQYYDNGYAGDTNTEDSDIPLHQVMVQLHMKAELKDETSIKMLSLLDEFYIEVDNEEYIRDDYNEEEYYNPDYRQVTNINMLQEFDTAYYKLNEAFMEILEQYLRYQLTTMIPIWDYKDDYYFAHIDDLEINIRIYEDNSITLWIYDHKINKEKLDENYKNIVELKLALRDIFKFNMDLPNIDHLKEITNGQAV